MLAPCKLRLCLGVMSLLLASFPLALTAEDSKWIAKSSHLATPSWRLNADWHASNALHFEESTLTKREIEHSRRPQQGEDEYGPHGPFEIGSTLLLYVPFLFASNAG